MAENISLISTIVPINNAPFPTHDAQFGKGGLMSVSDIGTMNEIPAARRTAGMGCIVQAGGVDALYVLDEDLVTWTLFTPAVSNGTTSVITLIGNTTLTNAQFAASILTFQGSLTAEATITLPPVSGSVIACNYTSGGFTLTLTTGAGTSVTIAPGLQREIFSNGQDVAYSTTDFNNVTLGINAQAVTMPASDNSNAVATTAFVHTVVGTSNIVTTFNSRTGDVVLQATDVIPLLPVITDGGTF